MRSSEIAHPGPTTPVFFYWAARLWMWLFGWDVEGEPPAAAKGVLIAAPHTSNWDLPHMLAAAFIFRYRVSWLGKDSLFRFPFGWFMKLLGGIPVDRSTPRGLVQQAADLLTEADQLVIAVPPSGTRSKRDSWKSGFYWIAHTAQVPVVCGYLDYARRRACLGFSFVPTGDVKADMDRVRAFYDGVQGRFPALQSTVILKEERQLEDKQAKTGAASEHGEDPGEA